MLGPEEAVAGSWGPWLDVVAEVLDPGHKVESLAREVEAGTLATRGWPLEQVEQLVLAIGQRKRGKPVRVFTSMKLKRGP